MHKLKLRPADLQVTTFELPAPPERRGTVAAHLNEEASGPHITCDAQMETCAQTCSQYTCFGTCVAVLCGGSAEAA